MQQGNRPEPDAVARPTCWRVSFLRRRRSRGWSLIELAIALVVIAVVIGAVATQLGSFTESARTEAVEQELLGLADMADEYAMRRPPGNGNSITFQIGGRPGNADVAVMRQFIPASFDGKNPYGRYYEAHLSPKGDTHFIEARTCVPAEVCTGWQGNNPFVTIAPGGCGGECKVEYRRAMVPNRALNEVKTENEYSHKGLPPPPLGYGNPPPPGK